jgi:methionine-rich copper-binding protein CopC
MKRKSLIAVLAALMVMISTVAAFADSDAFQLKSSYPKNGQKNTSIENVGVQLHFNHSISSAKAEANNEKCVKIVDSEGKEIPIKVLTSKKEKGLMLVLGDSTNDKFKVENNAEYTLVISKDFTDDQGNMLGQEQRLTFKTFNQRLNNIINMVMMFAIFGGIMVMTVRQQRQQSEGKDKSKEEKKDAPFNPYREAKRTGKSLEEVIEEEKKREEKEARKNKRKNKNEKESEEYVKDSQLKLSEILPNVYAVHGPRPISAAGGKYKSGRAPKQEEPKKRGSRNNSNRNKM